MLHKLLLERIGVKKTRSVLFESFKLLFMTAGKCNRKTVPDFVEQFYVDSKLWSGAALHIKIF